MAAAAAADEATPGAARIQSGCPMRVAFKALFQVRNLPLIKLARLAHGKGEDAREGANPTADYRPVAAARHSSSREPGHQHHWPLQKRRAWSLAGAKDPADTAWSTHRRTQHPCE